MLDDKVKELVCEMSGKDEYEFGDLSVEIDKRVKESVADFCGKDTYEFGDLSKEVAKRAKQGVLAYTGKGDYKFGDITKQALKNLSGKDDYQVSASTFITLIMLPLGVCVPIRHVSFILLYVKISLAT